MRNLYARWITDWELRLATRDKDRKTMEFDWGREWLNGSLKLAESEPFEDFTRSDEFYAYQTPDDFQLQGERLTFTSPVHTPHPENNTVHAAYFPAKRAEGRAVVVVPQWNADEASHVGLCKLLNRFGISALRMNKAYHGPRKPNGMIRADHAVSPNIGRTISAVRQSVIDARSCVDWLSARGYDRLGIVGTSLGSCVAFITAAHEPRLSAGAFNHVSYYFGDVVWNGFSTQHVRAGLEGHIDQEQLRRWWAVISPAVFLERMQGRDFRSLLIWGRYDPTFLPEYSQMVFRDFRKYNLPHKVIGIPCGHYTIGQFPFNLVDGFSICRFLRKQL